MYRYVNSGRQTESNLDVSVNRHNMSMNNMAVGGEVNYTMLGSSKHIQRK